MTKAETNKTPPRNNYANAQTPIASIKRPRSSIDRARPRTGSAKDVTAVPDSPPVQDVTTATPGGNVADEPLSPLHPPKAVVGRGLAAAVASPGAEGADTSEGWVGRKVDALFSPVLTFLNEEQNNQGSQGSNLHHNEEADAAAAAVAETTPSDDAHHHSPDDDHSHSEDGSLQAVADMDDDFNPWQFIKSLPNYDLVRHLRPSVALPPKNPDDPPVTLVLDLDETLVHCSVEEPPTCDLEFGVEFHGMDYQVYVKLRPHLQRFLNLVSKQFEVIVFTASQPVYANELLDRIDPNHTLVQYRLFRESCLQVEGNFLKDLTVLGRDLSKTVLVDNSPHAFGYQLDNGIPIESWFDDMEDRELLKLERWLRQLQGCDDVRPLIREKFQNQKRVDEAPEYAN